MSDVVLLRVVDLETSGLSAAEGHKPCEAGWTDVRFNTKTRECEIGATDSMLFSVGMPMPPEASAVHHLTDDDLRGLPEATPDDLAQIVRSYDYQRMPDKLRPFAIVSHNLAMESQWFTPEVLGEAKTICTMKAARRIWPEAPGFSNGALRYWRNLDVDRDRATPPHRAGPDTYVTACLLVEMLKTETVNDLVRWTMMPVHYDTCPLQKHRGQKWGAIPHDYLLWITRQPHMEEDIKAAARAEIEMRRGAC